MAAYSRMEAQDALFTEHSPHGMTGFGFFGISVSLPEPWCEVTEPDPGIPRVHFQLKSP